MAKAKVGTLNVMLAAKTGAFVKSMRKSSGTVTSFTKRISSSGKMLVGFGSAIAGVAAGAGMAAMIRNTLSAMDATTKLGVAVGVSTSKLAAYQFGAQIAGSSQESLNKGLKNLQKTIGETTTGISTEGVKAFELLGLEAKTLSEQPISETFKDVAESIKNITNVSERAAIAQRIFGRAGKELINLLLEGRAGLEAYEAEAKSLGIAFDELSGAKVEMANDAMTRLTAIFKGAAQTITIKLTPFIIALSESLTELGKTGGGMGAKVGRVFDKLIMMTAKFTDVLALFKAGWHTLKAVVAVVIASVVKKWGYLATAVAKVANTKVFKFFFGGGAGRTMASVAEDLNFFGDALVSVASDEWDKALKNADQFMNNSNSKAAKRWIGDLNRKVNERAADLAAKGAAFRGGGSSSPTSSPSAMAMKSGGPSQFSQIVRSRIAGGVKRKVQRVSSPEIVAELKDIIRIMDNKLGKAIAG